MNIFVSLALDKDQQWDADICTGHCVVGDSCQLSSSKYFAAVTSSLKIEIKRPMGMHCIQSQAFQIFWCE